MPDSADASPAPKTRRSVDPLLALTVVLLALAFLVNHVVGVRGLGTVATEVDGTTIYRSSVWMWLVVIILFVVIGLMAFSMFRRRDPIGTLLGSIVVLAGTVTAVILPASFSAALELRPDGFHVTDGFWWDPQIRDVRFDELRMMTVESERADDGKVSQSLECLMRDGRSVTMPLGTLLRAAFPAIRNHAERRSIVIVDATDVVRAPRNANQPWTWRWWAIKALPFAVGGIPGLFIMWHLEAIGPRRVTRMVRALTKGEPLEAISIGESVPPAKRSFLVSTNLVIAYQRAGRQSDARALLATIEAAGSKRSRCPKSQFDEVLAHLRTFVSASPDGPENGEPTPHSPG